MVPLIAVLALSAVLVGLLARRVGRGGFGADVALAVVVGLVAFGAFAQRAVQGGVRADETGTAGGFSWGDVLLALVGAASIALAAVLAWRRATAGNR